jgi:hypothetical protein
VDFPININQRDLGSRGQLLCESRRHSRCKPVERIPVGAVDLDLAIEALGEPSRDTRRISGVRLENNDVIAELRPLRGGRCRGRECGREN